MRQKYLSLPSISSLETCYTTSLTTLGSSAGSMRVTASSRWATPWSLHEPGVGWSLIEARRWITKRWAELWGTITAVPAARGIWPWWKKRGWSTDSENWPYDGGRVRWPSKIVRFTNCASRVFVCGQKNRETEIGNERQTHWLVLFVLKLIETFP